MTPLTERYLEETLKRIPERQRADVEGELRSSIADAIEDRVAAREDRAAAERAVLEGLGNPAGLAAAYTGRPMYLIGPELFPLYWHILPRLVAIVLPIAAIVRAAVEIAGGGDYFDAIATGIGGAIGVAIGLAFWVTLTFVLIERLDATREARTEIARHTGRWTVDMLPEPSVGRVTVGEAIGEVVTVLITLGGLLVVRDLDLARDASGTPIPILDPAFTTFWFPFLVAVLGALAAFHVIVYVVGRWTLPLATGHAALQLSFAVPIVLLAVGGTLINPEFAAAIEWPPLAEPNGPVMLAVAAGTTLVTAWEIFDGYRRARVPARTVTAAGATSNGR